MEIYRFKNGGETSMNEKRLLEEFLELVQIDSETKHEADICKVLKEKFAALGMDVVEDDTAPKRGTERETSCARFLERKRRTRFTLHPTWIPSCPEKG